jgi:serine/threonine-protein kinase
VPEPTSNAPAETAPTAPTGDGGGSPARVGRRYQLVRLIARGGMAEVWEGVDEVLARPVAVKVLLPHLARDAAFVERFRREAVAAARLSHPNIVALFDTCSDGGSEAIVMALVRGSTLREVLDQDGPLSPARVIAIGAQVADALDHAHRSGLIHRDVKPGNILLSDDGRVLVADFGIAKAAETANDLTEVGQIVGTAKYLSPEQVEGKPLDVRSDVYSLGIVLYEALCGRPPFDGDNSTVTALARLTTTPLTPRQVRPGVPRALESVLMKAMARLPDQRYPTAAALRQALLAVDPSAHDLDLSDQTVSSTIDLRGVTSSSADPTPPGGVAAFARQERSWIVPAALIVVIAATVGLVGALLSRTEVGRDLFEAVRPGDDAAEAPVDDVGVEEPPGGPVVTGRAVAFDPLGNDGGENDQELGALTDGDPATAWSTDRYNSRTLGNLKPGVGFVLPLQAATDVQRVELDTATTGWAASVHVADGAPGELAGWGEPVAQVTGAGTSATFELGGRTAGNVLVWFTDLGNGSGGRFQVQVREVRVVG